MEMTRFESWPRLLAEAIEAARGRPFSWGEHDCCLFAATLVLAMTGTDPAARFRGKYKTARGAAGIMKRFAGGGVAAAAEKIAAALGCPEVPPRLAGRGDVVLFEAPGPDGKPSPALGVCVGATFVFALAAVGVGFMPMGCAIRAWKV